MIARNAKVEAPTLICMAKSMVVFARALWGRSLRLEARVDSAQRRATFNGDHLWVPERYPGFASTQARRLFFATVAHIGAHRIFSGERFPIGGLKPLQMAIVGAIEDARVEALAMRRYPGLARLWRPFHVAEAGGGLVAESLLARLSRALIDPAYADDDPWVQKGRAMFEQAGDHLDDPSVSRHIGDLLGNDMGQMRVQFNAKAYVVEPAYRDDNLGLWNFDDLDIPDQAMVETVLQGARIEREETSDSSRIEEDQHRLPGENASTGGEEAAAPVEVAIAVAKYPEWDFLISAERPDWTTVTDTEAPIGDLRLIQGVMETNSAVVQRVRGLVRTASVGRVTYLRRQHEGEQLDLDACIEVRVDQRLNQTPDPRVYRAHDRRSRDMSLLLLLDTSQSTADPAPSGRGTILDLERASAVSLAMAMAEMNDPFAIHGFCSDGRDDVRYLRVKEFRQTLDDQVMARLAGLSSGLSTRMGTAMRHAGRLLQGQTTHRKLLLLVTDGEPSDIDVSDRRYLVEDARKVARDLARFGVDAFCVGLDPKGADYLVRIFGPRNFLILESMEKLPEKLAQIYLRLRA